MLEINSDSGYLSWNSKKIAKLSTSEILILCYLLENANNFSKKEDLLNHGWPNRYVSSNSLTVAIQNIRKALSVNGIGFDIETVHGKGYILHGEEECFTIIENKKLKIDTQEKINKNKDVISSKKTEKIFLQYILNFENFHKCIYYLFIFAIVMMIIIVHINTNKFYCYDFSPTTRVCGVFYLNNANKNQLNKVLLNENGEFLYGYDTSSHEVKIYKIH